MLQEESLAKKFIHKGFWLYLFTFLSAPLSYIMKMLLARDMSLADFGIFYGIISLITLLSALNDIGGTESLNYFLPQYIIKKEYGKVKYLLGLVFRLQIFSSAVIIALIFLFSEYIATMHFKDISAQNILVIMSLFFLGNNLLHIGTSLFSATQNTKLHKATDFIRLFFTTIFVLIVFLSDFGSLTIYAWTWISGMFLAILFALFFAYKDYYVIYLKNIPTEKDAILKKELIKYAIPTFLTANSGLLLSQIDSQLVIGMLGNEAQGMYSNYLSIMTLPFLVLSPMIAFLFPVFTELHARKQKEKMQFLYTNMMLVLIILGIWTSCFLFQSGKEWAIILFGNTYAHSGIILQFSVPFLIFNILYQLNFQLLAGIGKAWQRTVSILCILPLNIILNLIFIPKLGVEGSALAVGISWIPLFFMTLYASRQYIKLPSFRPILLNIFLSCFAFGLGYFLLQHLYPHSPPHFALIILIGIYATIFLLGNISLLKNFFRIFKTYRS